MSFCFEALESTKIGSYLPVSSQKYENLWLYSNLAFAALYMHLWFCSFPCVFSFFSVSFFFSSVCAFFLIIILFYFVATQETP